jgi:hypothetical protein
MQDKDSPAVDKDVRLERERGNESSLREIRDGRVDWIGLQPY